MLRAVVLLCAAAAAVAGQTTAVTQCTNHAGDLPLNTYVGGCATPPCQLPQLQDAVINVVFKAPRVVPTMTTLATAYLSLGPLTIPVPYDLGDNAVTCNFLTNTYCPVLKDEVITYTLKMYIEPFFPVGTSVIIEFRVVDEVLNPVLCIRMPIQIVSPVASPNAHNGNSSRFFNRH